MTDPIVQTIDLYEGDSALVVRECEPRVSPSDPLTIIAALRQNAPEPKQEEGER